jgi:hypothetical protein
MTKRCIVLFLSTLRLKWPDRIAMYNPPNSLGIVCKPAQSSRLASLDQLSGEEIDAESAATRKARREARPQPAHDVPVGTE